MSFWPVFSGLHPILVSVHNRRTWILLSCLKNPSANFFALSYLLLKLSITLDTLTARILKLSSDSQIGIEPTPFYSWWNPADCRADPAVAPVTHEIPPDHEFQLFHFVMFCLSALMIKQFLFHPCPNAFTSRITKAVQRWTVYPIGRGSIKYIWWEWQKCLTNLRMYGSKSRICRNAYTAWMRWQWGKVKFVNMKYLGVLKALPSCQVYSRHLSIYVKIGLSERGSLQYALCGTDEEQ